MGNSGRSIRKILGVLGTIAVIIRIVLSLSHMTHHANYTPPPIESSANPPMTAEEKIKADENHKAVAEAIASAKKLFGDANTPPYSPR